MTIVLRLFIMMILSMPILCGASDPAPAPRVVVTIKPLYEFTKTIMKGVTEPELLIDGTEDPHHFSLKPSHMDRIQKADFIIWVGPTLETFLVKPLLTFKTKKLTLIGTDNIHLLNRSRTDSCVSVDTCYDPKKAKENKNDLYDLFSKPIAHIDPHIWLSVSNAILIVKEIAYHLSAMDLAHAAIYQANAKTLQGRLETLQGELADMAKPLDKLDFIAFHDGYGYLEHSYGLRNRVADKALNTQSMGLKTLTELSQTIHQNRITCLLVDPQHLSALEKKLAIDHKMTMIQTDPLGLHIPGGDDHYIVMMRTLVSQLLTCLPKTLKTPTTEGKTP